MSKITLTNLVNLQNETTAVNAVNANNATLIAALDNTLSRDGTSPNTMSANLDMNSMQILNLPSPSTANSPARLVDIQSTISPTPAILSGNNVYTGNNSFTGTTSLTSATISGGSFANPTLTGTANATTSLFIANSLAIYDASDYGIGTGVSDNGVPLNALITTINTPTAGNVRGGVILLPFGILNFSTPIDMSNCMALTIRGKSGKGPNVSGSCTTRLVYTGTGATAVILGSAVSCALESLELYSSNAGFSGYLVRCNKTGVNDPGFCRFENCSFGGLAGTTANGINLHKSEASSILRCVFGSLATSITGRNDNTGYAVGAYIRECEFTNGFGTFYIINPDATWLIDSCIFEPSAAGKAGALYVDQTAPAKELTITNCWCGDVTVAGGTWFYICANALVFQGNYVSSNGVATTSGLDLESCQTFVVTGNVFEGLTNGISFFATANQNINPNIEPNHYPSTTNPLLNTVNMAGYGNPGYTKLNNGCIMMYGNQGITIGTPVTVTYPKILAANPYSVQVSLTTPTAGTNTVYTSSVGTTSMVVNAVGTAGGETFNWTVIGALH